MSAANTQCGQISNEILTLNKYICITNSAWSRPIKYTIISNSAQKRYTVISQ